MKKCTYIRIISWIHLLMLCSFLAGHVAFALEKARFYDWKVDDSGAGKAMKRCHLHFTGVSNQGIKLSMRLSLVEKNLPSRDEKGLTMLKITAGQINPVDRANVSPIAIKEAWIVIGASTTLGKIHQLNTGSEPYFLAGIEGFGLFLDLLDEIHSKGIILGYRSKHDRGETTIQAPPPPAKTLDKLHTCLIDRKHIKSRETEPPIMKSRDL